MTTHKADQLRRMLSDAVAEIRRLRSFLSEGDQQRIDSEMAWQKRALAAEQECAILREELREERANNSQFGVGA